MKYEEPPPVTKSEAERVFGSSDLDRVRETLVCVALHEPDWRWVQEWCLRLLDHDDTTVRAVAATCMGHVARIHRQLDLERSLPALRALLYAPETRGYAESALEDVAMFIRR